MKSAYLALLVAIVFTGSAAHAQELSSVALRRMPNNVASRPDSARPQWAQVDSTLQLQTSGSRLTAKSGAAYGAVGLGLLAGTVAYFTVSVGCDLTLSLDGTSSCHPERQRLGIAAGATVLGAVVGSVSGAIVGGIWDAAHKR